MINIMLDTNILITGLAFNGNERKLLNAIYLNKANLILNEFVIIETKTILSKKFPILEKVFDDFLQLIQAKITPLPELEMVKNAKTIIRDPKDAVVLASAILFNPDVFVSGDLDFHTTTVKSFINVMHTREAIALVRYHRQS